MGAPLSGAPADLSFGLLARSARRRLHGRRGLPSAGGERAAGHDGEAGLQEQARGAGAAGRQFECPFGGGGSAGLAVAGGEFKQRLRDHGGGATAPGGAGTVEQAAHGAGGDPRLPATCRGSARRRR